MITLVQKTSQVLLHMSVAFAVTYGFTGSLAVGGVAAIVEPVCNVLLLPLHDRVWQRIRERLALRPRNVAKGSAAGHAGAAAPAVVHG